MNQLNFSKKSKSALIGFLCLSSLSLSAQNFMGKIECKVDYKSDVIPAAQLAQQPSSMVVKIGKENALLDDKRNKQIAYSQSKEIKMLVNLSMMGLGKYVMSYPEAEYLKQTEEQVKNIQFTYTDETKDILGYKAKKATGTGTTPQGNIELEVYYVEDFTLPFFNIMIPFFTSLKGFPLEYTIKFPQLTQIVSVKSMNKEEVLETEFSVPKSYKATTKEELESEIKALMGQ